MRSALLTLTLAAALGAPASAQSAPAACAPRTGTLAGIGRASVVEFVGPIFGDHVCATVANLSLGSFSARIADADASDALVSASLAGAGANAVLALQGMGDIAIVPGDAALGSATATAPAGPYVVAPGGQIPDFGGDTSTAKRVVLAYAGQRLLVIATSPVALADLARVLRSQPDVFGASDAVERAIVIASGPDAEISLDAGAGERWQSDPAAAPHRFLLLTKR